MRASVSHRLRNAARVRQQRLVAAFTDDEVTQLWALLRKVEAQVPVMNAE